MATRKESNPAFFKASCCLTALLLSAYVPHTTLYFTPAGLVVGFGGAGWTYSVPVIPLNIALATASVLSLFLSSSESTKQTSIRTAGATVSLNTWKFYS